MRSPISLGVLITSLAVAACGEGRPSVSSWTSSPRSDAGASSSPSEGGDDGGLTDATLDGGDVDPLACPPVEGDALPATILCRPEATWGSPVLVTLSEGDDALAAVSADERTVAWFHVGGPTPQLLVADRPDLGSAFGSPQAVAPAGGMFGSRAALSPDGLQLVVVGPDQRQLVVLARGGQGEPFAVAEEGSREHVVFARLNTALAELPEDRAIDDPVWSKDGAEFLFSVTSLEGATIHAAATTGSDAFSAAVARTDCELASHGVGRSRRPTGMSADGLTLFYFDEARNLGRAAFRARRDAAFSVFVDLGGRTGAEPNAACNALWSLRTRAAGSSEIVRETR